MVWLKLTSVDGAEVLVNLTHAAHINNYNDYTRITFAAASLAVSVKEMPEHILTLAKSGMLAPVTAASN